ncbi:MAG: nucleoside-diphosphate kinase [Acidobacteriota bacterium]
MAKTLTIIKPDAVAAGNAGNILAQLEGEGFTVRGLRLLRLTEAQAKAFYAVHAERPFYGELVSFMTSGPVIPAVLEREDAVPYLRQVMGATNSEEAAEGTIRNRFGTNIERNAIHGSDSEENAAIEIAFFFSQADLIGAQ